jgi:hypothetical protein
MLLEGRIQQQLRRTKLEPCTLETVQSRNVWEVLTLRLEICVMAAVTLMKPSS